MKKAISLTALSLCLFCASFSQFRVNMGVGASFGKSPEIEAAVGYNWSLLNITGGMQVHTSSRVAKGALLELKIGHEIPIGNDWGANPYFGGAYHYLSADQKNLNITRPLFGIELYKMFREDIGVYGNYSHSGVINILSFGVKGYF